MRMWILFLVAGCGSPLLSEVPESKWAARCEVWAEQLESSATEESGCAFSGLLDSNNCPALSLWSTCDLTLADIDTCVDDLAAENGASTLEGGGCPTFGSVESCAGVLACDEATSGG